MMTRKTKRKKYKRVWYRNFILLMKQYNSKELIEKERQLYIKKKKKRIKLGLYMQCNQVKDRTELTCSKCYQYKRERRIYIT